MENFPATFWDVYSLLSKLDTFHALVHEIWLWVSIWFILIGKMFYLSCLNMNISYFHDSNSIRKYFENMYLLGEAKDVRRPNRNRQK